MISNEFNNTNENTSFNNCSNCDDLSNNMKNFTKSNPTLTTGILVGSALVTANIISPSIRKITIPTCKFVAKQQLKLLAGIGVLSIATYIASHPNNMDDDIM